MPAARRPSLASVLAAALAVAVLDGLFATGLCMTLSATCTVARTWQGVAAALVGRDAAVRGGAATFALGLAMHGAVALTWAALFGLALARSDVLARAVATPARAALAGVVLGAVVWIVMNRVVVPLTLARTTPLWSRAWWILLAGHLVVVGPPITLIVRRRGPARARTGTGPAPAHP